MQRRSFLKNGSVSLLGITALSLMTAKNANADVVLPDPDPTPEPVKEITITSTIAANHGHELVLTEVQVLKGLRTTAVQGATLNLDIKGKSVHPHTVVLNQNQLMELVVNGQIVVASTKDAGHSHQVTVKMEMVF